MSRPWIAKGRPFRGIFAPKSKELTVIEDGKSKAVAPTAATKKKPVYCGEMAFTQGHLEMEKQMLELAKIRAERIALDVQIAEDQLDLDNYNSLSSGNGGVVPKRRR